MKVAANISVLFRELPVLDRFAAARAAGFDGVELQFPYDQPLAELARAHADCGLPTALINGPVIRDRHPYGICARPEMRATFREQLPLIAAYASALGAPRVHLLAGVLAEPDEAGDCWNTYADNLLLAAGFLGREGIRVTIEPINAVDAPGYLLSDFDDALSMIERCRGRVGLQFDVYHAARMRLNPAAELARRLPVVEHVQFADAPGRHEPGSGRVDFGPVLEVLRAARYSGWVSAEYSPSTTTDASLAWLAEWRDAAFRHSG
jgi:hydroxypyruvate isomerase